MTDVNRSTPSIHPATVEPGVWERLAGMTAVRDLIERRVVLPIHERDRAAKHGLVPPATLLLFGPPGTGKTLLSSAIASRLGWALVEVDLPTVALDSGRLHRLFDSLFQLEEAVISFDEFEHLGLRRDGSTTPVEPLTAELLRGLPALRDRGRTLLICATNYVRMLEPALLRPGRFDLVIPVGLPDETDRAAILAALLQRRRTGAIAVESVARRTEGLTAADLEAVCQSAGQAAFEREVHTDTESRLEGADLLAALERVRPTVSAEEELAFQEDVERFARV